ncbi:Cleavage stimulation factor subunit 2 [Coemansia sp. RSA 2399]|nr:Cleavage stimulation factor subunit 2 [Coemansia sp. RSA 2399]KAJ1905712.1 Cleavage stimulation factor subunit 2 [Coemansia sp. IMI 209127]
MMDYRFEAQQESNIVFLGNVAYDTTEEQLRRVLELAGPVVDIKLIFDQVTNRAKGFGFCQYVDVNTAASAINNLNDTQVDGRNIKIGYADRDRVRRYLGTDGTTISGSGGGGVGGGGGGGSHISRPPPTEQAPFSTSFSKTIRPEQVDGLMASLDDQQKNDLLVQFRSFANVNTTKAKEELSKNPALAYALLSSLEALNMVDRNTLSRIKSGNQGGGYNMPSGAMRPPHMPNPHSRHPPPPQAMGSRMPVSPPFAQQRSPMQNHAYSEPASNRNMASPGTYGSATPSYDDHNTSSAPPENSSTEMNNAEVLKQLLSLTDEQLAQLPEDHRQQIVDLKRQLESA